MPQDSLEGQVAVVTGAGRGIGRAIALAFAAAGATVVATSRTESQIGATVREITRSGGKAFAVRMDVTRLGSVTEAFNLIFKRTGTIDVLVNNAGTNLAYGPIWEVDPDDWVRDIETSLHALFYCSRAVLPHMIERASGRIINLSSGAATEPRPMTTAYSAAKTGAQRFSESLASAVGDSGVKVFSLNPGPVQTTLTAAQRDSPWWVEANPGTDRRYFPPERAAEYALTLASGRADALAGRFVSTFDDLEEVIRRAPAIVANDLRRLVVAEGDPLHRVSLTP